MKLAVVSFSHTGHVDKIVGILKKHFQDFDLTFFPIESLERRSSLLFWDYAKMSVQSLANKCCKIKTFDFQSHDYDHIIFITPVWVGKLPPAMNTFFRDNEINCSYSVILSCFVEFDFVLDSLQSKKLKGKGQLLDYAVVYDLKPDLIEATLNNLQASLISKLKIYNNTKIHNDSLFS